MLTLSGGVSVPPAGSASQVAIRRLQKDYAKLVQDPVDGISALPNDENILEWHYCLRGSPETPFEGGYYWGKVIFKENFPWSPPAITMITPNGRFSTNTRLCLSISDYHPESWNPGWTVSAILIGLHSFMNENQAAAGAINGTAQEQRNFAAASKEFNCTYREFRRFFPQFVQEWTGVTPQPNEPNVAPVMLAAHATPAGITVPSIHHHSSRDAYALAAHHDAIEQMMNAARGAANQFMAARPPAAMAPAPPAPAQLNMGGVGGPAPLQGGYAAYMGPPPPAAQMPLYPRDYRAMAAEFANNFGYHGYQAPPVPAPPLMAPLQLPPQPQPQPRPLPNPAARVHDPEAIAAAAAAATAAQIARQERLARFRMEQINGGPIRGHGGAGGGGGGGGLFGRRDDPVDDGAAGNANGNANGTARRGRTPQDPYAPVPNTDGAAAPKRQRGNDGGVIEPITLD